tara:strand:+ start:547 stop:672 length:126 start_codon:yes stop_codon:yes gene_type:complete
MSKKQNWEDMTPQEKTEEFTGAFLQALVIIVITILLIFAIT